MTSPIKIILDHEYMTDRLRTRSLARQQWSKVIECDAVLDACKRLRAAIARDAESDIASIDPKQDMTPTQTQEASLPPATTALDTLNPFRHVELKQNSKQIE